MKQLPKTVLTALCLSLVCAMLLTACADGGKPSQGTTSPNETVGTAEPAGTSETSDTQETTAAGTEPEPIEPLDMDALIGKIVSDHPSATPEELCAEIAKSPYFLAFRLASTEYSYPGFPYDYKPSGIESSHALMNYGTESVVLVLKPKAGTDADGLISELKSKVKRDWEYNGEENDPDTVYAKAIDGRVFFALYHSDLPALTECASKPEEIVGIFRNYCSAHPDADCAGMASYLAYGQNFDALYARKVKEGMLKGLSGYRNDGSFDESPFTGFSDGAIFCPQIDPSGFLGYVFRVPDGEKVDDFVSELRKKANPGFNVCTVLAHITVETEGQYVLFMMFG